MSNETERDQYGMEQLPDGMFVQRTYSHENDARLTAIEAKIEEVRALLEVGIRVQVVTAL